MFVPCLEVNGIEISICNSNMVAQYSTEITKRLPTEQPIRGTLGGQVLEALGELENNVVIKSIQHGDVVKALLDASELAEEYFDIIVLAHLDERNYRLCILRSDGGNICYGIDNNEIGYLLFESRVPDVIYVTNELVAKLCSERYAAILNVIATPFAERSDFQKVIIDVIRLISRSFMNPDVKASQVLLLAAVNAIFERGGVTSREACKKYTPFASNRDVAGYDSEWMMKFYEARGSAAHGGSLKGSQWLMENAYRIVCKAIINISNDYSNMTSCAEVVHRIKDDFNER